MNERRNLCRRPSYIHTDGDCTKRVVTTLRDHTLHETVSDPVVTFGLHDVSAADRWFLLLSPSIASLWNPRRQVDRRASLNIAGRKLPRNKPRNRAPPRRLSSSGPSWTPGGKRDPREQGAHRSEVGQGLSWTSWTLRQKRKPVSRSLLPNDATNRWTPGQVVRSRKGFSLHSNKRNCKGIRSRVKVFWQLTWSLRCVTDQPN